MNRSWSLASMASTSGGARSAPWTCQLMHAQEVADEAVLDLVALEPCPSDPGGCPTATPFTVHVRFDRASRPTVRNWCEDADVVTIVTGTTAGGEPWLCLAGADRLLVLAL